MISPRLSVSARLENALAERNESSAAGSDATWERVAAAFAHTLLPIETTSPQASEAWRSGDARLTPASVAQPPATAGAAVGRPKNTTAEPNSLTVNLNSEEFGQMSLVVQQCAEGTRVLLSVDQLQAFQTLQLELQSLGNVLRAAGLNVASLRLTQRAGTALAKTSTSRRNIALGSQHLTRQGSTDRRRVKVIG